MQQKTLFHKFSSALSWNAFLYIAHRIFSTILVFTLYRAVPTPIFSTWATVSSVIYLILLWLDFGFRKSIARYAPIFAAHRAFAVFTRTVLIFQLTVLLIALPLFSYLLPHLFTWIVHGKASLSFSLRMVASGLFITESLTEILRLLYHAHFLNKPFNLLTTSSRLLESIISILLISNVLLQGLAPSQLIVAILFVKFLSGLTIIIIALLMLPKLYRTALSDIPRDSSTNSTDLRPTWYKFARHSALMWFSNLIKSLSERNFILPLLTHLLGPASANTFKLAQDSALLFERSIIKTIGTADTALLAHSEGSSVTAQQAFTKLTRQVAGLCIPLFGILLFLFLEGRSLALHTTLFQLFLLLTATYLLEVLVSPYERILEVKQRYILLALAYMPYIGCLFFLFYTATYTDLISFILLLQGVRLVSSFLMVFFAHRYYRLGFPTWFMLGWLTVAAGCALGSWTLVHYLFNQTLLSYVIGL